jgi:cell division septal protein FtsQ
VYKPAKKNIHPYIGQSRINKRYTQSRPSFTKLYWLGGILIIIAGALGWWLFLSPTFRLTEVTASPAKNFSADDLTSLVWEKIRAQSGILPKDNLWLVDTNAIGQALNERYYLDKLKISKNWPHRLNISFEEKNYALAWGENNNYYLINYQGDIISQGAIPPNLLIIYNRGAAKAGERRIEIEEKYLSFADNLNKAFAEKIKGLNDRQFFLDDEINTVKIQITNGPVLKFNTEDSIDKQLVKLETIRKQELSDGRLFNSQKYLDLRYGDRIFYQ